MKVVSSAANRKLSCLAETRCPDALEASRHASSTRRFGRLRRQRIRRRRSNSRRGRTWLGLAFDAGLSRAADRGDGDPSRRDARNRCGGHRFPRRLAGLLAIRASTRVHRCHLGAYRSRNGRTHGTDHHPALTRSAPSPSGVRRRQSDPEQADLGSPSRFLREYPEQAVPAWSGPRATLRERMRSTRPTIRFAVVGALVGPLAADSVLISGSGAGAHAHHAAARHETPVRTSPDAAMSDPVLARLGLPAVAPGSPLPGYQLIADRDNNRLIIVDPRKRIVWRFPRDGQTLSQPDDAFVAAEGRSISTNQEFAESIALISLSRHPRVIWRYGHPGVQGSAPGYLAHPDDAYLLANGEIQVADIINCRVLWLSRRKRIVRSIGQAGNCTHAPPHALSDPNGDTPLPDGGVLVTEIGGWGDRRHYDRTAHDPARERAGDLLRRRTGSLPAGRARPAAARRTTDLECGGHATVGRSAGRVRAQRSACVREDDHPTRRGLVDDRDRRRCWHRSGELPVVDNAGARRTRAGDLRFATCGSSVTQARGSPTTIGGKYRV